MGTEGARGSGIHPDGSRFVAARTVGGAEDDTGGATRSERVVLIENFFEELRERAGR